MDLMSTKEGTLLQDFYPAGWNLKRIDECCSHPPESISERQEFWNPGFEPVQCDELADFNVMLGLEIATAIKKASDEGRRLALILPMGPMGMYKWTIYFLKKWKVSCDHVTGFNMDEWSDAQGNTLPASDPRAFENAMQQSFYGPLDELTVPVSQRYFATKDSLPRYGDAIAGLKAKGARMIMVYGIGRSMHIAFWEPHFAADFKDEREWRGAVYGMGVKLHPMSIEQLALTCYKSRFTLCGATANTIGPGVFLQADQIIGGCDGIFGRGMQWQGVSLWTTLRYGPDMWIPSTFIPTLPGSLFYVKELAGPLTPENN
jgi:glucosamine-6-phosphate deaminase